MHLLLAGATGLVGGAVMDTALANGERVTAVGRRETGRATDEVTTDFSDSLAVPEAAVAICALGTTIATAGSRDAFRAVDHGAVLAFARAAQDAGIEHFLLVSGVGANPRASVFYSKVKGEAERDLQVLGFRRLDIAQPGLLLGERHEHRPSEALLQRMNPILSKLMPGPLSRYAGIEAQVVARALLALSKQSVAGVFRHENRALRALCQ